MRRKEPARHRALDRKLLGVRLLAPKGRRNLRPTITLVVDSYTRLVLSCRIEMPDKDKDVELGNT